MNKRKAAAEKKTGN